MKKLYALFFAGLIISIYAADTPQELSYHEKIIDFILFLTEKNDHISPIKMTLAKNTIPTRYTTKSITIQRINGKIIDECLQALRDFDWENKQENAPEGSTLAGKHAQFLALANSILGVNSQTTDEDGNLTTTFEVSHPIETIVHILQQVPGVEGFVAFLPRDRCMFRCWKPQDVTETDAS